MLQETLVKKQTFHSTTLAEIAKEGDVPLGNVYYYFKTKDAIIMAVIEQHQQRIAQLFGQLEEITTPRDRLKSFVDYFVSNSESTAHYGCAIGSLCQELSKQENNKIAAHASNLMKSLIQWTTKQFETLGSTRSLDLAEYLVSSIQGISLLTLTFKQPNLTQQHADNLHEWIAKAV